MASCGFETRNTKWFYKNQMIVNRATPAGKLQRVVEFLTYLMVAKIEAMAAPYDVWRIKVLNDEIEAVKRQIYQICLPRPKPILPQKRGRLVGIETWIPLPVNGYAHYNLVGRLIGPRGSNISRLELASGCKIEIINNCSNEKKENTVVCGEVDNKSDEKSHGYFGYYVRIRCQDFQNRAKIKVRYAAEEIEKLLVWIPDGMDYFKREQLMQLAVINGTYKESTGGKWKCKNMQKESTGEKCKKI